MANKRSKKFAERFYCPFCKRRMWRIGSPKFHIRTKGVVENSWIEEFFCEEHNNVWLLLSRQVGGKLSYIPAEASHWKQTSKRQLSEIYLVNKNQSLLKEDYAIAWIKDYQSEQPFSVGQTYQLQAGIQSEISEKFGDGSVLPLSQQETIQLEIVVWAEDMDLKPAWIQQYLFSRGEEPSLVEFQLQPTQLGRKQIRIEFLYQRHWLAKIEFKVEVVEKQELVSVSSSLGRIIV